MRELGWKDWRKRGGPLENKLSYLTRKGVGCEYSCLPATIEMVTGVAIPGKIYKRSQEKQGYYNPGDIVKLAKYCGYNTDGIFEKACNLGEIDEKLRETLHRKFNILTTDILRGRTIALFHMITTTKHGFTGHVSCLFGHMGEGVYFDINEGLEVIGEDKKSIKEILMEYWFRSRKNPIDNLIRGGGGVCILSKKQNNIALNPVI